MEKPVTLIILILMLLTAFSGAVAGGNAGSPGLVTPGATTSTSGNPGQVYDYGKAPDLTMTGLIPSPITKKSLVVGEVTINATPAIIKYPNHGYVAQIYDLDWIENLGQLIAFYSDHWEVSGIDIGDAENIPAGTPSEDLRRGQFYAYCPLDGKYYYGTIAYGNNSTTYAATYEAHRGKSLNVTFSIENIVQNPEGAGATAGPFWVGFYLSKDIIITKKDIFIGRASVPGLKPGPAPPEESNPETLIPFSPYINKTTVTIPTNISPGFYYIGAIADYDNLIPELDEKHNYYYNPTQMTIF